jgi:hypothetical protein
MAEVDLVYSFSANRPAPTNSCGATARDLSAECPPNDFFGIGIFAAYE